MATKPVPEDNAVVNPLEELIGYQLRRSSSALMSDLARALERFELRPSEASVLVLIGANPRITQSEIGRILAIKRANMAPLSAGLERRGLIDRTRVDGRSQGLSLTEEGEALAAQVFDLMRSNEHRFLGKLAPDQRTAMMASLQGFWG